MKVTPIVALVSEDVVEILRPIVDQIVDRMDELPATSGHRIALRLNGWTPEMLAWGQILRAASEVELEIVVQ